MNKPTLTKRIYHALTKDLPEGVNTYGQLMIAARLTRVLLPTERRINKSEHEEVYLPFDQRPLYAQMSDGSNWTGVCKGHEYFGDDITDPYDGVTADIGTRVALRNCGLCSETTNCTRLGE